MGSVSRDSSKSSVRDSSKSRSTSKSYTRDSSKSRSTSKSYTRDSSKSRSTSKSSVRDSSKRGSSKASVDPIVIDRDYDLDSDLRDLSLDELFALRDELSDELRERLDACMKKINVLKKTYLP